MNRQALDFYGTMPEELKAYLRYNGWHFNKKLCEYAVRGMKKKETNGKKSSVEFISKEKVDEMLNRHGVILEENVGYDYVYAANMIKADFYGRSIADDMHMALMIKDIVDDVDQADGFIMHRWYADMIRKGTPVDWEEML